MFGFQNIAEEESYLILSESQTVSQKQQETIVNHSFRECSIISENETRLRSVMKVQTNTSILLSHVQNIFFILPSATFSLVNSQLLQKQQQQKKSWMQSKMYISTY